MLTVVEVVVDDNKASKSVADKICQLPKILENINNYTINQLSDYYKEQHRRFVQGTPLLHEKPSTDATLSLKSDRKWQEFYRRRDYTASVYWNRLEAEKYWSYVEPLTGFPDECDKDADFKATQEQQEQ